MVALKPLSEEDQKAFFDELLGSAREAEARTGTIAEDVEIGGTIVRMLFAGSVLHESLFPALNHLRAPPDSKPDLHLHVWESQLSGVALPAAPCSSESITERGEIWTMPSRSLRSAFHWMESSLSMIDLTEREAVFWVRDVARLPYWTLAAPFRGLLGWWMEENGGHLLHAAAVGVGDEGVLITGKGGVGKSTTALVSLQAGMRYVGDDYVIVDGAAQPRVWSLYRTAKVNGSAMADFVHLAPKLGRFGADEKAVIYLDSEQPLARSLKLKAILTPEFGEQASAVLQPVGRDRIRNAALFTTLCQLPHVGQRAVEFIDSLLDRLPGFILRLGTDRAAVPAVLQEFLAAPPVPHEPALFPEPADRLPLVSVIIPVHNGARFVGEAMESVLAQAHPALDIIIVDDGSVDEIETAVSALPVDVRFLRQDHAGPAAARNRGILNAAGDYIAFLDVDDLWPAGVLETGIRALLADPDLDVVIGRGQRMERSSETGEWCEVGDPADSFPHSIPAAIFRRRVFRSVGLFDERLRFGEDYDWFLRAEEAGAPVERTERTTLRVRRHGANMTEGKNGIELVPLRLFKNVLDRRRANAGR